MTPGSAGARLREEEAGCGCLCHSRPQHLRGIPIELFLMCFNFHFLLLENTDGGLLPLILSGAGREGGVRHTCGHPSQYWGTGASAKLCCCL